MKIISFLFLSLHIWSHPELCSSALLGGTCKVDGRQVKSMYSSSEVGKTDHGCTQEYYTDSQNGCFLYFLQIYASSAVVQLHHWVANYFITILIKPLACGKSRDLFLLCIIIKWELLLYNWTKQRRKLWDLKQLLGDLYNVGRQQFKTLWLQ